MWHARSNAVLPLLLALAGFGCGSEETQPPAAAVPPPQQAPAPSPATPEPAAAAPEWTGELPADFPADVPQYPGSKVAAARGTADLGVAVTFDSPDGIEAISRFYSDGLAAAGWQTQVQQIPEGTMIIADKEGRRAQAMVHAGGQGTLVDMIIARLDPE